MRESDFVPKQHIYIIAKNFNAKVIIRNGLKEKLYDYICYTSPDTIIILGGLVKIKLITESEEERGKLIGIHRDSFIFYDNEVERLTEKILRVAQDTLKKEW